jgi:hypothetical protein
MNKKKNMALTIASIFLLLALLDGWQYGFFTILRFVVFFTTAHVAYLAYKEQKEGWVWFMGAIAVLFNPFIPIYLTREVWVVIDGVIGTLLITSIFAFKISDSYDEKK